MYILGDAFLRAFCYPQHLLLKLPESMLHRELLCYPQQFVMPLASEWGGKKAHVVKGLGW